MLPQVLGPWRSVRPHPHEEDRGLSSMRLLQHERDLDPSRCMLWSESNKSRLCEAALLISPPRKRPTFPIPPHSAPPRLACPAPPSPISLSGPRSAPQPHPCLRAPAPLNHPRRESSFIPRTASTPAHLDHHPHDAHGPSDPAIVALHPLHRTTAAPFATRRKGLPTPTRTPAHKAAHHPCHIH